MKPAECFSCHIFSILFNSVANVFHGSVCKVYQLINVMRRRAVHDVDKKSRSRSSRPLPVVGLFLCELSALEIARVSNSASTAGGVAPAGGGVGAADPADASRILNGLGLEVGGG